jgi:hypothetical protein
VELARPSRFPLADAEGAAPRVTVPLTRVYAPARESESS